VYRSDYLASRSRRLDACIEIARLLYDFSLALVVKSMSLFCFGVAGRGFCSLKVPFGFLGNSVFPPFSALSSMRQPTF